MAFGGFDAGALMPTPIKTANPLEMAEQAMSFKSALLGNQIQQAEYDARLAQGRALQQATDAGGRTDYAKARAAMAADPAAAYGAAEAYSAQNRNRAEDVLNQDEQLAFQTHASAAAADGMGRVIADPSNANVKGYAAFMSRLTPAAAGQIGTIADQVMALPTKGQRVEALKAAFTAHMGQEASNRVFGAPTVVDDGNTIQSGTQAAAMDGGAFTPTGGVQRQVSPESNAHLVPVTMKDPETGQMITVYRPAGELRQTSGRGNFTGRRVDTSGGASAEPMAGTPTGYDAQYKTGQDVQNALAGQQNDVTQNVATLRNLDSLLSSIPKDARSRTLKDIANNLSKFGIGGESADRYATLAQEIDKAGTTLRKQMMDGGAGLHTNAGLSDLEHITPGMEMTPTAARALTNEMLTAALYQKGRQGIASRTKDPTKVMQALADYDQAFDPRFATIQRLGPEEGREYARTHISDPREYTASVRRMAQAQRDRGYDYGLTSAQIERILGPQNGR